MKELKTLNEINKIAETTELYVRWSRGLEFDKQQGKSLDYNSRTAHAGLSCQRVYPNDWKMPMMLIEYRFLRRKDSEIFGWVFSATQNGTDSDNAPTVDAESIFPVGKLSQEMVEKLSKFNDDYWAYQRTSPKTPFYNDHVEWRRGIPQVEDYI